MTHARPSRSRDRLLAMLKLAQFPVKKRLKLHGFDVSIESPKGSIRRWYDPHGKETGSTPMHFDYGYLRRTEGTDGDHVDVYVGPHPESERVFVVDQMKKPDFKEFDEQKVMLGFRDPVAAKAAYHMQYNDPRFFGSMKEMGIVDFREKVLAKENHGEKVADRGDPWDRLQSAAGALAAGTAYLGHRALAPSPPVSPTPEMDMKKLAADIDTFVTLGLTTPTPAAEWETEKQAVSAGWIRERVAQGAAKRGLILDPKETKAVARAAVDYAKNKLPSGPGLVSPRVITDAKAVRDKAIKTIGGVSKKRPFVNEARRAANEADAETFHRYAPDLDQFHAALLGSTLAGVPHGMMQQHRMKRDNTRMTRLEGARDALKEAAELLAPPPPGSAAVDYSLGALPLAIEGGIVGGGVNTAWQHARNAFSKAGPREQAELAKMFPNTHAAAQHLHMFDPHHFSGRQLRTAAGVGAGVLGTVGLAGVAYERRKQQKRHEQGMALKQEIADLQNARLKEAAEDPITARAERIDDIGLAVLGVPAAAHIVAAAMKHAPESWARTRAAGAVLHGIADSVPAHASEIAGLAMVSPTVSRRLAEATTKEAGVGQVMGEAVGAIQHGIPRQMNRLRSAVTGGAEAMAHNLHGGVNAIENTLDRKATQAAGTLHEAVTAPSRMAQEFRAARHGMSDLGRAQQGLDEALIQNVHLSPPVPTTPARPTHPTPGRPPASGAPLPTELQNFTAGLPGHVPATGLSDAAAHPVPHTAPPVPHTAPGAPAAPAAAPSPAAEAQMGTLRRAAPLLALGGVGALGAGGYAGARALHGVRERLAPENAPLNIDRVAPSMGIPAY